LSTRRQYPLSCARSRRDRSYRSPFPLAVRRDRWDHLIHGSFGP
jgi:hypothetical protein